MKKCSKCNVEKSLEQFTKYSRSKDGRSSKCKQCAKEYRNSTKGKELITKYNKNYRKTKKEKDWSVYILPKENLDQFSFH